MQGEGILNVCRPPSSQDLDKQYFCLLIVESFPLIFSEIKVCKCTQNTCIHFFYLSYQMQQYDVMHRISIPVQ